MSAAGALNSLLPQSSKPQGEHVPDSPVVLTDVLMMHFGGWDSDVWDPIHFNVQGILGVS